MIVNAPSLKYVDYLSTQIKQINTNAEDSGVNLFDGVKVDSSLTMDAIKDLDFEHIISMLMKNDEVNPELGDNLTSNEAKLAKLEKDANNLRITISNLEKDLQFAEANKKQKEAELDEQQNLYVKLIAQQGTDNECKMSDAYKEALKKYEEQDKNLEYSKTFEEILDEVQGGVTLNTYESDIKSCLNKVDGLKITIRVLSATIMAKNADLNLKKSNLTNIQNNIKSLNNSVAALEIQAADANFINENKTQILALAEAKNPENLGKALAAMATKNAVVQAMVDKYKTTADSNAGTMKDPQLQKLSEFLKSDDLANLSGSDLLNTLVRSFSKYVYTEDDGKLRVGVAKNDSVAASVLNDLSEFLETMFSTKVNRAEIEPRVFIIGSYQNSFFGSKAITTAGSELEVTLGRNILDFAGADSGNGKGRNAAAHNGYSGNDAALLDLYSRLSDKDKQLTFDKGQAYIISEYGEIIGVVANNQVKDMKSSKTAAQAADSSFKILQSLNIDSGLYKMEEGCGGEIEYKGLAYTVGASVVRQETPLILDFTGNGVQLTSLNDGVNFDIDGNETVDRVAWTKTTGNYDYGFLVLDKNGDGAVNGGKELFGAQNGAANGFLELAKYDLNANSAIDENDEIFKDLKLWFDLDGDGVSAANEFKTLADMGVKSISLNFFEQRDASGSLERDQFGNTIGLQGSFITVDNKKHSMIDALLNTV